MAAVGVDGQAIAKGLAQETEVARAEDDVVGIVHDADLRAALQIVFQRGEAGLARQIVEVLPLEVLLPERHHLLGHVAVEVALQRTGEEARQAGALADRVGRRGDQAATVDQVGGKGDVGCREAEGRADQHGQFFVAQPLRRALEVAHHGVVEVDVALFLEVAGQLGQDQLVEGAVVGDALHLGLHQAIQVAYRGQQIDRRIDHQHLLEIEAALAFVQVGDEGGVQAAQAVAGQVVVGDRQLGMLGAHRLHGPIEVLGIVRGVARGGRTRHRHHEVPAGGRGQLHHVVAGRVIQPLEVFLGAGRVVGPGAGDQEDQRRRMVLAGEAVVEFLHRPEVAGQLVFPLRTQVETVVILVDGAFGRQLGAEFFRRGDDGGFERIDQWIAIGGGIHFGGRVRGTPEAGKQRAQQGGDAQRKTHGQSPFRGLESVGKTTTRR